MVKNTFFIQNIFGKTLGIILILSINSIFPLNTSAESNKKYSPNQQLNTSAHNMIYTDCDLGPLLSGCVGGDRPTTTLATDNNNDCVEDSPHNGYPEASNPSCGLYRPLPYNHPLSTIRGRDAAFNVIVNGNLNILNGAEIEGKTAVGGNLIKKSNGYFGVGESGGGTFVVAPSNQRALVIRGTTSGGNNSFGVGGTGVLVGGNYDASQNTFPNWINVSDNAGTSAAALGLDFDNIQIDLAAKSQYWSTLPTTGVNRIGDNTSTLQVFNTSSVPSSGFSNIPNGATVLVNVSGTNPNVAAFNAAWAAQFSGRPTVFRIIWNFYEATFLSIPSFKGTVIAPYADVTLTGASFDGRIYAGGNLTINGTGLEIHNYPFVGVLPCVPSTSCTNPTANNPIASTGTCSGSSPNNDASVTFNNISNGNIAGIIASSNYSSGVAYNATVGNNVALEAVSGNTVTFSNLNHNTQYTIRLFNGSNICFTDFTITTAAITCNTSPPCNETYSSIDLPKNIDETGTNPITSHYD